MADRDRYAVDERQAREKPGARGADRPEAGAPDAEGRRAWGSREAAARPGRPGNRTRQRRQRAPADPAHAPLADSYRGDPSLSPPRRGSSRRAPYRAPYPSAGMRSDYAPRPGYRAQEEDEDWVAYGRGDVGYDPEGAFYQDLDEPLNSRWNRPGRFTGLGPLNYQRSDRRIREDACERLARHGWIDARAIEIDVRQGEVTLTGTVPSRQMKRLAADAVESVAGVKDVQNEIQVSQPMRRAETRARPVEKSAGRPYAGASRAGAQVYEARAEASPAGESSIGAGLTNQGVLQPPGAEAEGDRQAIRSRLRKGMQVLGKNGKVIGRVKEIRADDFLIDRALARDVYAPFSALQAVGEKALLKIGADEVDKQGWPKPALFF